MLTAKVESQIIGLIITWSAIIQLLIYCFVIYKKYHHLSLINKEIRSWFLWLFGLFVAFIASYTSYYILVNFSFFNNAWDYAISFTMTFFIFFLSWFGYLQPKVFSGFKLFETIPLKYKSSPISKEISIEIIQDLQNKMNEKKYYLQSDLNLEKLSNHLNISKHYLSQAINEVLDVNFFEYINVLRINEAKELLIQKEDLTIIEIAYQIGYNNKASFNKAFKNIIGITPTEFRAKEKSKSLSVFT